MTYAHLCTRQQGELEPCRILFGLGRTRESGLLKLIFRSTLVLMMMVMVMMMTYRYFSKRNLKVH